MNILIVSSYLPYPLFSGGHIRLYNLIKQLSKNHKITLICEKRNYQTDEDKKELEKFCQKVITVDRKKQWSISNIFKTLFSSYPFLMVGHKNSLMEGKIKEEIQEEKFDLIHVETFYVMHNLPSEVQIPIILAEQNIEYLVYDRFAKSAPLFLRPFLNYDIKKIKHWEKKFWKDASKLIAVSEEEKIVMEKDDVVIVPNGVDVEKLKVKSEKLKVNKEEKSILFIGDFRWIQNRDAVNWILKEIWHSFAKAMEGKPEIRLWIVGREIPDSIKKLTEDKDVIFDENAPKETNEIYKKSDILLAPIRIGGGTSYKILEAMASGVPVVTTSLGIEGIEAKNNENVLIADNASEIAEKIKTLLENNDLYAKIAKNARLLIEEKYDWRIIAKKLEEAYQSAVSR